MPVLSTAFVWRDSVMRSRLGSSSPVPCWCCGYRGVYLAQLRLCLQHVQAARSCSSTLWTDHTPGAGMFPATHPGLCRLHSAFWLAALKCQGLELNWAILMLLFVCSPSLSFSLQAAVFPHMLTGSGREEIGVMAMMATARLAQHIPPWQGHNGTCEGQGFCSATLPPQTAAPWGGLNKLWCLAWDTTAGTRSQEERRGFQKPHLWG